MNSSSEKTATVAVQQTVFPILFAVCFGHFLNDMIQAILPSTYLMLRENYHLTFGQIGLITAAFQVTASILQPFVGNYTDKHSKPYSFVGGMFFSLLGIVLLAYASGFISILIAASFIGIGSSVFHPEASRVSYYASGGRRGLAQSIFQLGGNAGFACGSLIVFLLIFRQTDILWFCIAAVIAIFVLSYVGKWYKNYMLQSSFKKNAYNESPHGLSKRRIWISIGILLVLIFSKFFYTASISSFLTSYLHFHFHVPQENAPIYLAYFSASVTLGTLIGGPLGDKYGRKLIIWFSILGAAPFALALPYVNFQWTIILVCLAGAVLASAFSSILVYAQELLPGKIGMISGLFYGFAFGMGGVGSAVLGAIIDVKGIEFVYFICSFLPLLGIITIFLPNIRRKHA